MAGVTAQGGTFTFAASGGGTVSAHITGLSVETPQAEVVDMTPLDAPASVVKVVPTGSWSGGAISVDYIHAGPTATDPQSIVRQYGVLSFSSAGYSVSRNVILESASTDVRQGDVVRGQLKFRLTDYTG